jgi:Flp pilus assembly protein TadD
MTPTREQLIEQGLQFHRQGKLAEAEQVYHQVLRRFPDDPDALNLLGVIELRAGRFAEGLSQIQRAISFRPAAEYHLNLGRALVLAGRYEEAAAAYRKCVDLNPLSFEANCALGDALLDLDEAAAAVTIFQRCMAQRPQSMIGITGLGSSLLQLGDFDQALARCDEALRIRPEWPVPHCNRGQILLTRGDFASGWPEFEWRWQMPTMQQIQRAIGKPLWDGSDLSGRRILIHYEAGIGDTLNYLRYIPLVAERGGRVIFRCQPELHSLLRATPGVEHFLEANEPNPEFDLHCPMMSLPAVFRMTSETVPPQAPLVAEASAIEQWESRLPNDGRLKVGLVWSGKVYPPTRAVPLKMLAALGNIPSLWLCSLQKGEAAAQLAGAPSELQMADFTHELKDYSDTAALIANLDLILTVDTSLAHLAGAMGKRVWLLLKYVPDWRWQLGRGDTPWYPAMRLFRQSRLGDWSEPIAQTMKALAEL